MAPQTQALIAVRPQRTWQIAVISVAVLTVACNEQRNDRCIRAAPETPLRGGRSLACPRAGRSPALSRFGHQCGFLLPDAAASSATHLASMRFQRA